MPETVVYLCCFLSGMIAGLCVAVLFLIVEIGGKNDT